jgi:tetratricopeptide (TPR) repeat protein
MSRFALIATALLCGAAAAGAQETGDCGHPVPERSIFACSAVITRGGAAPETLASFYRLPGAAYVIHGDYDNATADLDEALRLNPEDPEAFTSRGDACAKKAGVARVVRDLSDLPVGAPYFGDPSKKNEYARAIADYDRALGLDGGYRAALHGRALARLGSGENNRVEDDLLLGGLIQHMHRSQAPFVMRQLSMLLDSQTYMRMAAERFTPLDGAVRDHPSDPQVYLDRAWAFVNFGKFDFAIADYTQALVIDANNAKAYIGRSEVFRDRGEYDRAIEDANEALRVNANDFRGYALRGFLLEKKRETDKAIADYRRALSLEPGAVEAIDGLGRLVRRADSRPRLVARETIAIDGSFSGAGRMLVED